MSNIFTYLVRDTGGVLPLNTGSGAVVDPIKSQGLLLDSDGAVYAVIDGTPAFYHSGLPFDANGRLCVSQEPVDFFSQAIPFTATGQLAMTGDGTGGYYSQGLLFGPGGGLAGSGLIPPPPVTVPDTWGPQVSALNSRYSSELLYRGIAYVGNNTWAAIGRAAREPAISKDNGATWAYTTGSEIGRACIASDENGTIIHGGELDWYVSRDFGDTWTQLPNSLSIATPSFARSIDTDGNGNWLATFDNSYGSVSTDDGVTWTEVPQYLGAGTSTVVGAVWTGAADTWVSFVQAAGRSTNNGTSWGSTTQGLGCGGLRLNSFVAAGAGGTMLSGCERATVGGRSTDYGATWVANNGWSSLGGGSADQVTGIDYGQGRWFMVAGGDTIGYSDDDGLTWSPPADPRLGWEVDVTWWQIKTDGNGIWMAYGESGRASRSLDNGDTWQQMQRGLVPEPSTSDGLGLVAAGTGVMMSSFDSGWASRSTDSGLTWQSSLKNLNNGTSSIGADGMAADDNGAILCVGDGEGYASRSLDNGLTWLTMTQGLGQSTGFDFTYMATDKAGTWTAGGVVPPRPSVSTDNGANWSVYVQVINDLDMAFGNGIWIAACEDALAYTTTDPNQEGAWTAITPTGLNSGTTDENIDKIATDGAGTWVACFNNAWAARSTDNGATWTGLVRGLETGSLQDFNSINTDGFGNWIVGNRGGYCAYSADNGATWNQLPRYLNSGATTGELRKFAVQDGVWTAIFDDGFTAISPPLTP